MGQLRASGHRPGRHQLADSGTGPLSGLRPLAHGAICWAHPVTLLTLHQALLWALAVSQGSEFARTQREPKLHAGPCPLPDPHPPRLLRGEGS